MKVGDLVRLVHGKEQGRVVKILDAKQVEVEIEDGFRIPILRNELVIVASEESAIHSTESETSVADTKYLWGGIYIAFSPFNDHVYEMYLVNHTSYKAYFGFGEEKEFVYTGVLSGVVERESIVKIGEVDGRGFEHWPEYTIQMIFFGYGKVAYVPPFVKKIKFRSTSFFKSKKLVPVLNKEAYSYRIDAEAVKIEPKVLEEQIQTSKTKTEVHVYEKPHKEIDLHIEKLTDKHAGMSNSAMLALQLDAFQKNLDNAQASGMEEIIFIHGVGNGVLKREIHKVLSGLKTIQFFQEAQKDKFGYGATLVRFKKG